MKFRATEQQARQIMANAVNASVPMGLGLLSAANRRFAADDFRSVGPLDYVQGRMVKLRLRVLGDGVYGLPDDKPRSDYQSWASTYPTHEALVTSAGVEIDAAVA